MRLVDARFDSEDDVDADLSDFLCVGQVRCCASAFVAAYARVSKTVASCVDQGVANKSHIDLYELLLLRVKRTMAMWATLVKFKPNTPSMLISTVSIMRAMKMLLRLLFNMFHDVGEHPRCDANYVGQVDTHDEDGADADDGGYDVDETGADPHQQQHARPHYQPHPIPANIIISEASSATIPRSPASSLVRVHPHRQAQFIFPVAPTFGASGHCLRLFPNTIRRCLQDDALAVHADDVPAYAAPAVATPRVLEYGLHADGALKPPAALVRAQTL